jgi:hypothetical protein
MNMKSRPAETRAFDAKRFGGSLRTALKHFDNDRFAGLVAAELIAHPRKDDWEVFAEVSGVINTIQADRSEQRNAEALARAYEAVIRVLLVELNARTQKGIDGTRNTRRGVKERVKKVVGS